MLPPNAFTALRSGRRPIGTLARRLAMLAALTARLAHAQGGATGPSAPTLGAHAATVPSTDTVAPTPAVSGSRGPAWFTRYPWNGVNVWYGSAIQTRTASHNEVFAGYLHIAALQVTRDLWRGRRSRLEYVGEFLPALSVRSGAPDQRIRSMTSDPTAVNDGRLPRYAYHDSYGVGLAPFGLELSAPVVGHLNALVNCTAGAVLFTHIVPYGDATAANFTVSPGAALQLNGIRNAGVAVGYTLHHLSNASFGKANPGMNSHVFYVRVTRLRHG